MASVGGMASVDGRETGGLAIEDLALADSSAPITQAIFIDSRAPGLDGLLQDLSPGEQAFVVDADQDGLQQIAQILAADHLSGLSAIDVVGHETAAGLSLGSATLDAASLSNHAADLALIGGALSSSGDLSLYAAPTAHAGLEFVSDLTPGAGAPATTTISHPATTAAFETASVADHAETADTAGLAGLAGLNTGPPTVTAQGAATPGEPDVFILSGAGSFSSGGTYAASLQSVSDTGPGTYPDTATTFFSGPSNESTAINTNVERVMIDPLNNDVFIAITGTRQDGTTYENAILKGSLSGLNSTSVESFSTVLNEAPPTENGLVPAGHATLEGLALDPASGTVYFTEGDEFKSTSYNGTGTTLLATASASGQPNFLIGLALDTTDHTAYFGAREEVITTNAAGTAYTTTFKNALYEDSNIGTAGQTLGSVLPLTGLPGSIDDVAIDPLHQYLYITTAPAAGSHSGIYKYNLATNAVTTVFDQHGSSISGTFGDIVVEANGKYYVEVNDGNNAGSTYVGSTSGGTPSILYTVPTNLNTSGTPTEPIDAAVDLPPSLSLGSHTSTEPVQGGAAVQVLIALPTAADPDGPSGDLAGATVSISSGYQSGDTLAATLTGAITIASNTGGVLTLTGTGTFAQYQQVLESVTYQDAGTDGTTGAHPSRTLTYSVTDGLITSPTTGDTVTLTIDRAPATATHTATLALGGAASASSVVDSDLDGDTLTVTGVATPTNAQETTNAGAFTIAPANGYSGGTLTINSNDTYSYAAPSSIGSLHAGDLSTSGAHPVDTFTYTISDGHGGTATETLSFTIDRPPTVSDQSHTVAIGGSFSGTGTVTGTGALANDSDPDSDALSVAGVTPSGGAATPVASTGTTTIHGTYGDLVISANGTDTYSPGATTAEQNAIAGASGHPTDSFAVTIADNGGPATSSETLNFTLDSPPTAPTNTGTGADTVAEGATTGTAVGITAHSTDPNGDTLTYSITNDSSNGGFAVNSSSGVVTVANGADLSYPASAPGHSYSITVQASDGTLTTSSNFTVAVTDVAPSISGTVAGQATSDESAVTPFSGVTIGSAVAGQQETVSVTLSSTANGSLSDPNAPGDGGGYDPGTGVYTVTGTAAHDTAAIDALVFTPTEHQTSPGSSETTTFTIDAGDGTASAAPDTTTTVIATAADDAPTLGGITAETDITDEQTATPFSNVTVGDVDTGVTITATVTPSATANGTLSDPSAPGDGGSYDSSTGIYTVSGTALHVQAALEGLVFTPTAHQATPGSGETTTFTVALDDAHGGTRSNANTQVIATAASDTPTITSTITQAGQTTTDEATLDPFAHVSVNDVDHGAMETLTVTLKNAGGTATDANGTLSGTGLSKTSTGVYTLATDTPDNVSGALEALVFTPTAHQTTPGSTVTTTFVIDDSDNHGTSATNGDTTVVATAKGDPTVALSAINNGQAINASEAAAGVTISGTTTNVQDGQVVDVKVYDAADDQIGGFHSTVGGGAWSLTVSPAKVQAIADGSYTVTADVSDAYGEAAPEASQTVRVHETLPTVSIAPLENGTNVVNASEAAAGVAVSGATTGVADDTTVHLGVFNSGGVKIAGFTASDQSGAWSVQITAAQARAVADGTYTLKADVTDAYGNAANQATDTVQVHETLPTVSIAPVEGNNVVTPGEAAQGVAITGSTTGVADGTTVQVTVYNAGGQRIASFTASDSDNAYTVNVSPAKAEAVPPGTYTLKADVTDSFGNVAHEASDTVTVSSASSNAIAGPAPGMLDLRSVGLAASSLGVSSLGVSSLGVSSLGVSGLGVSSLGVSSLGASHQDTGVAGLAGTGATDASAHMDAADAALGLDALAAAPHHAWSAEHIFG